MTAAKSKIYNSWAIAQEHGNVWITGLSGQDYRDGQLAWWGVCAPEDKMFTPDPKERIYLRSENKYHVFVTFDDAAKWCLDHYKITGFKRDKFGSFHPSDTEHDRPCGRHMSKTEGRSYSMWPCDRLSVDGGECKLHRSISERHETKRTAQAETERLRNENSTAGHRIAQDAIDALAEERIKAKANWNGRGYNGRVSIHAEDVLAIVRELRRLREILNQ